MDETQTRPELSQEEQANPPSRKRQLDSDDDDDAEPQAKRARTTRPTSEPARLTQQNLARFNKKMGSKKTSDPSDDYDSGSTKTVSTMASGFAIQAYKNGVLDPSSSKPPKDLEEIYQRSALPRGTPSPTESEYGDYVDRVNRAANEATVVIETVELLKKHNDKRYNRAFNQAFTAFPKDVGFNHGLSAPQPDFVEGPEMRDFLPFPVDERILGAVLYKDNPHAVTLPHIAGEWKGPDGSMAEATLQSSYDGAALVYARNQALAFQGKSDPPRHVSITTFTTNGTQLNFYAHYAAPAGDGTLEYHQFPVRSTSLVNSYGEYKEGRKHLRNEQDHARRQSQALRDELKEYYKKQRGSSLHPVAKEVPPLPISGIGLDAYKDEDDYKVVEPQPVYQPTPPTLSKHRSGKTHSHHSHHSHHLHSTPHSLKAPSSTHSSTHSSGSKRKASSSQSSHGSSALVSKHRSYWKKDHETGQYYHMHSDGTVSWLDDDEDKRD
ncbi:hypothetical protein UCRPA7_219 [Phaeoacremonium minimum UCRPA7]|uniref:Uncharacterized protein n=1 Tax=Phaeoacremonium minimum (strain UCR-PA7) TaxID=1286976 RepID=R8BXX4_PHAM7|nr:hypothetical protein UCRPA7_219 [Phaeoacremonium minimum UCRPA7]EOO04251.1 hypothetical protein UCRPA7_219 [Phaeoacremonium minimum UCRPA7]